MDAAVGTAAGPHAADIHMVMRIERIEERIMFMDKQMHGIAMGGGGGRKGSVLLQEAPDLEKIMSHKDGTPMTADEIKSVRSVGTEEHHQTPTHMRRQSSVSEEINRNLTHIGDAANDLRELAQRVRQSGDALDGQVQVLDRELGRLKT